MFNISGNRTLCKWLATCPSLFGKTSLFDAGEFHDKKNASPHFSPRVWKGEASAPPLQGLPDYSCVPCPAVAAATCRKLRGTRDQQRAGAAIPAGLKPRPPAAH